MKTQVKQIALLVLVLALTQHIHSQEKELEHLASEKKKAAQFPLTYKILLPRLAYPDWDKDYDRYQPYTTPALRKTQASLSYNERGVVVSLVPNSIMPHAQLDTSIAITDPGILQGTWRMLTYRSIRFNDSVYIPTKSYYRLADTLLDDRSQDEAFAIFDGSQFKLYARETGKTKFKREISSKFQLENRRYIMLYKFSRGGAGVSQVGIDENGYLIWNYPKVVEYVKKGEYFSYYAIIEQYIFEKVK